MNNILVNQDKCYHTEFSYIYNCYYNRLVYFIIGFIKNQLAAEDMATDIFLKYWHKKEDFISEYKIKAYLFISARNACSNYRKQQSRLVVKMDLLSLTQDYVDPVLEAIVQQEIVVDANSVVESLPQECKKIIKLCFMHGQNNKMIAEILHLSENTVRNQKTRGIKLMQERFAKLHSG